MFVNVVIWYYKNTICAISFNEKCIWDSGLDADTITNDAENFMQIDVALPWMVAINFVITLCNGVSINRLKEVAESVKKRTAELVVIEQRNLELDLDLGDW